MQLFLLTFSSDLNVSLQVGDTVYYSPTSTVGGSGFNTINSANSIVAFGIVSEIYNEGSFSQSIPPYSVKVLADGTLPVPLPTDYIMFNKNKQVNSSSITGYYADVNFVNNSKEKIELFAIGSEVSESSK